MDNTSKVVCTKCGSDQITAHQKGFSAGKAIVGDILLGPIGLLAGRAGSNKIIITCLGCGNQFKPGQTANQKPLVDLEKRRAANRNIAKVFCPLFGIVAITLFVSRLISLGVVFTIVTLFYLMMAMSKPQIK